MTDEEFEAILSHADDDYDPVKAREYYLRTRKLKGRRHGRAEPVLKGRMRGTSSVSLRHPRQPKPKQTAEKRRKAVEAKVAKLKQRLERLKEVLTKLVKEAQERSGIDTPHEKAMKKAKANSDRKSRKPLTSRQKHDAAKRAKEAYEKEQKDPSHEVEALQEQIKEIRAKIKAAVADAHKQLARSKSAPHEKTKPRPRAKPKPRLKRTNSSADNEREGTRQNGT
jgi:DNA repair exonuclease SbcCD ATPase subunit